MRTALLTVLTLLAGCSKHLQLPLYNTGHTAPTAGVKAVYLLMGQSNMSGAGSNILSCTSATDKRFTMYKNGQWVAGQEPTNQSLSGACDPGAAFAFEMLRINPNQTIGIVNCAVGGTPIVNWDGGSQSYYLRDCMAQMSGALVGGHLAGVVFMQGEADAVASYPDWPQHFMMMVNTLYASYGHIPIVYGQIGSIRYGDAQYQSFRDAQASVNNGVSIKMVATADLPMMDQYHFDFDGLQELGKRFARAMSL